MRGLRAGRYADGGAEMTGPAGIQALLNIMSIIGVTTRVVERAANHNFRPAADYPGAVPCAAESIVFCAALTENEP